MYQEAFMIAGQILGAASLSIAMTALGGGVVGCQNNPEVRSPAMAVPTSSSNNIFPKVPTIFLSEPPQEEESVFEEIVYGIPENILAVPSRIREDGTAFPLILIGVLMAFSVILIKT